MEQDAGEKRPKLKQGKRQRENRKKDKQETILVTEEQRCGVKKWRTNRNNGKEEYRENE